MNYIIYKQNGKIDRLISCIDIESQLQPGENYLEGFANDSTQYVVNGQIVDMPTKPSEFSEFNYEMKTWIENNQFAIDSAKQLRQQLLLESDWTQLPNGPLTQQQQQSWATYRQVLRDITNQQGYPLNIIWPVKPE